MPEKTHKLSRFQLEFLRRENEPLLIAQTGISAGKTRALAWWAVSQFVKGKRIILCAQNYRALKKVVFRDVINLLVQTCPSFDPEKDYNKSDHCIHSDGMGEIDGATGENPSAILGFTEFDCLGIDEAGYCPLELYNYACDRLRGEGVEGSGIVRLTSSPAGTPQSSWFSALCKSNEDKVIRATALDNPFTAQAFKDKLKERYGEGTPLYRQQVMGEIVEQDFLTSIVRALDYVQTRQGTGGRVYCGVDFARAGRDDSVFYVRDSFGPLETLRLHDADSQKLASAVFYVRDKWHPEAFALDGTGGFGDGCYDLTKGRAPVFLVNFGEASDDKEQRFLNKRTEMYFGAAELIKSGHYIQSDNLKEELRATQYYIDGKGKTRLIPKDDIKKILGRSPDEADAFALSVEAERRGNVAGAANRVANSILARAGL